MAYATTGLGIPHCHFSVSADSNQAVQSTFHPDLLSVPPSSLLLDICANALGDYLPRGGGADEVELVVQTGQVHRQFQILLMYSPIADPAAAIAKLLWVLQVEGQRAAGAGWAEDMRALAPTQWWCGGVAGRPIGLSEEGGRVGQFSVTVALRCLRSRGS